MPIYRYHCTHGCMQKDAYRMIDDRHLGPFCEHGRMELRIMPTSVAVFSPYKTAVVDKEEGRRITIRNRDEHEAFLRRNNYEEVGNDKSMAPLPPEQVEENRQRMLKEEAAAPFEWQDTAGADFG